jgi:hypothetical protein
MPSTSDPKGHRHIVGPNSKLELRLAKGLANLKINLINDNKNGNKTEQIPVKILVHCSVSTNYLQSLIKKAYEPMIPANSQLLLFFRKTQLQENTFFFENVVDTLCLRYQPEGQPENNRNKNQQ